MAPNALPCGRLGLNDRGPGDDLVFLSQTGSLEPGARSIQVTPWARDQTPWTVDVYCSGWWPSCEGREVGLPGDLRPSLAAERVV